MMEPQKESEEIINDYFMCLKSISLAIHWSKLQQELHYLREELKDIKEDYNLVDCSDEEQ